MLAFRAALGLSLEAGVAKKPKGRGWSAILDGSRWRATPTTPATTTLYPDRTIVDAAPPPGIESGPTLPELVGIDIPGSNLTGEHAPQPDLIGADAETTEIGHPPTSREQSRNRPKVQPKRGDTPATARHNLLTLPRPSDDPTPSGATPGPSTSSPPLAIGDDAGERVANLVGRRPARKPPSTGDDFESRAPQIVSMTKAVARVMPLLLAIGLLLGILMIVWPFLMNMLGSGKPTTKTEIVIIKGEEPAERPPSELEELRRHNQERLSGPRGSPRERQ